MWTNEEINRLYKAVFHRKAVRKFKLEVFDNERLEELRKKACEAFPLYAGEQVNFCILSDKQTKGMVSAKAPHFLAVYARKNEDSLLNAGFMLQQIDLWLSSEGFGSCWLGMPKPADGMLESGGLPFVIMLAFGEADEEPHREETSQFKRKNISEITDLSGMYPLLEPVRLAPSGVNRQPWYISGDEKNIRIYGKKNSFVSKKLFGAMSFMDTGIAFCHLWLSASASGSFDSFLKESGVKDIKGHEYVMTMRLK